MSSPPLSARRRASSFRCAECGQVAARWTGRCPGCQAWGSMSEAAAAPPALRRVAADRPTVTPRRLRDVDPSDVAARPSGVPELDRVLGGGLVPGGVVLLAGEPGVGKSTLLLAAAQEWARQGHGPALIVTGEETAGQVGLRARRLGAVHPDIYLAAETDLSAVLAHIESVRPGLLVVDSIQTVSDAATDGGVGGVNQVKAVAAALTAIAKQRHIACVLVGHVTKDGSVAGPRILEHLVDVVLHFEGDRHSTLRMVRGVKNRFGPADEVGCFAMTDSGIASLADPSGLFLSTRSRPVPGTCATVTVQGRRALPVEVQTLVGHAGSAESRRTVSGLDSSRVAMVLAVLQRWGGVKLAGQDVLAATVGGARTTEPACDLAIALAIWSSVRDIPLPSGLVVIGELGLAADVRPVPGVSRRLAEAARLGFDHAIVPSTAGPADTGGRAGPGRTGSPHGLRVSAVGDLGSALRALGDDSGVVRWLRDRKA